MKINSTLFKIFVSILVVAAPLSLFSSTSFSGQIVYNNSSKTPIKGVKVILKDMSGKRIAKQYTDERGYYEFAGIEESMYQLDAKYNGEVGGIDMADLYLLAEHLMGGRQLSGLSYLASDVNGSGVIDWNDFWDFLVGWFVNGEEFAAGKWVFQTRTIDLTGAQMKDGPLDPIACTGDGDGDFEPGVKNASIGAELSYKETIPVSIDNYYEIPVYYSGIESVGGFSLSLNYSENLDIIALTSQIDGLNYAFDNRELRVSWLNTAINKSSLNNDAPLFTVKVRTIDAINEAALFQLNKESHLINSDGVAIDKANLTMPLIGDEIEKPVLREIYPNPVRGNTKIEYKLNSVSDVTLSIFNTNGQKLAELVRAIQSPGEYQLEFNVNNFNLSNGMYIYRLDCVGEQKYSESKTLIVSK